MQSLRSGGKKPRLDVYLFFDPVFCRFIHNREAYYKLLAKEFQKKAAGKTVDFLGFSIGAFIALQTYPLHA